MCESRLTNVSARQLNIILMALAALCGGAVIAAAWLVALR